MAIKLFAQSQKEQKAFEELVSFVEETNSQNNTYKPTLSQKNGSAETDYISPYAYLKEQNEDFFWMDFHRRNADKLSGGIHTIRSRILFAQGF